jgi:hypothetical protein
MSQAAEVIPSMPTAADMVREPSLPAGCSARGADHDNIVFLREASWNDFQALLRMRGEHSGPRRSYLCGGVASISPSRTHESIKSMPGRLVEVYCLERGTRFRTLGAWTLESAPDEHAAEPDECWIFGDADADRPHLAIDVGWPSGRIDKLKIYRKLGAVSPSSVGGATDGPHRMARTTSGMSPQTTVGQPIEAMLDLPPSAQTNDQHRETAANTWEPDERSPLIRT